MHAQTWLLQYLANLLHQHVDAQSSSVAAQGIAISVIPLHKVHHFHEGVTVTVCTHCDTVHVHL
jgi:hypothetical protein